MSDKRICGLYVPVSIELQVLACATLIIISASRASGFDVAAPFTDPLQALPDVIDSGVVLPGDSAPPACPATINLSALTLSEAVDSTLCSNPQIKASWANIKVESGVVGEARAAYLPTISGTVNALNSTTRYSTPNMSTTTNGVALYGAATWRLFDFGERSANRQAANNLLTAALASHDATLQKAMAEVVRAYFDAQTAKATLEAKVQNVAITSHTFETAERREKKGAGSVGDTLQATTAHARAVLEKNRAESAYSKSLSMLAFAMGIPTKATITLADDLYDKRSPDRRELEAWLAVTQEKHPAILAARARLDAAINKVTSTRSQGLPTVDLTANYYRNGYPGQGLSPTQSDTFTAGTLLSIPFFDGFSRTYKIRGAEAAAEQRKAELQNTEYTTLVEVVKAYVDAASSLQNIKQSEILLKSARAALASSQRKFDKGAADILEILNAQTVLADANQERIRSLAEWRESRLRLMASAGLLGRAEIGSAGSQNK